MGNIIITWSVGEIIGLCLLVLVLVVGGLLVLGAHIVDKFEERREQRRDKGVAQ